MARSSTGRKRPRGTVEKLPSGGLRVKVYTGRDPVTKRRHYLRETVPAGPKADRETEKVLTRLLNQVDERRNPRTNATVNQLLKRYLDHHFDGEPSTCDQYRGDVRKHIAPFIGDEPVGRIDADVLDSLYAELRRCREHCSGSRRIDHRTKRAHDCDGRCRPHTCKPLGATGIRHIHYLLSGAYKRAVRWGWVAENPMSKVDPPASPAANPSPPSVDEAASILNEAWQDEDWGTFLWLAMTTGARRGELCALRWRDVDTAGSVVSLKRAISWDPGKKVWFEKDTKTHQQRRVALDSVTVEVMQEHLERCRARARALGVELEQGALVFSGAPDASTWWVPSSVTQRYDRMVARLGIKTTLHKLRHYSATELISSGVDVRTVAGRLGHGSGGLTTLRVYSAWVSEADQRASAALANRVPERPQPVGSVERAKSNPRSPYEKLAVAVVEQVRSGKLSPGDEVPSLKEFAREHGVSVGTAQRAVQLLKEWGTVEVAQGRRATISTGAAITTSEAADVEPPVENAEAERAGPGGAELLEFKVRYLGEPVQSFSAEAEPGDANQLRRLLAAAVRRDGREESEILDYEMGVWRSNGVLVTTFVTMPT